jgi:hypothetical protein
MSREICERTARGLTEYRVYQFLFLYQSNFIPISRGTGLFD